jgi:hypothetical protein
MKRLDQFNDYLYKIRYIHRKDMHEEQKENTDTI